MELVKTKDSSLLAFNSTIRKVGNVKESGKIVGFINELNYCLKESIIAVS